MTNKIFNAKRNLADAKNKRVDTSPPGIFLSAESPAIKTSRYSP